jgi:hypothetical protein
MQARDDSGSGARRWMLCRQQVLSDQICVPCRCQAIPRQAPAGSRGPRETRRSSPADGGAGAGLSLADIATGKGDELGRFHQFTGMIDRQYCRPAPIASSR